MFSIKEYLNKTLPLHGIQADTDTTARLEAFFDFLKKEKNKKNLVGKIDDEQIAMRLFLDSALGAVFIPPEKKLNVIDVGCGAGFPGIVLKILRPQINLTLLDSSKKKIDFTQEAVERLNLTNVVFVNERAENAGKNPELREKFDMVASKALAKLPVLLELCAPFCRVGGFVTPWKGINFKKETSIIKTGHKILGLEDPEVKKFVLNPSGVITVIPAYKKAKPTPSGYPRTFQGIRRSPLKG